jgi:transcriptional regulator with XRE-family HTH domain
MKVHEKIRLMRESKAWSQEEMAEKLAMSVSGYSKIERGETKSYIPKLEQIAEVFDVDLMELLSFGERHLYLISDNHNHSGNVINSSTELAFENQKLHLIISHRDEIIDHLKQEIAYLKVMLEPHTRVET